MQGNQANATIFNNWKESVYTQCSSIVETNLEAKQYDQLKSREYANAICEQIIGKLSSINHNFKYIANCIILAAGGNGMDVAGLCYWDQEMDGSITVKWESKFLTCIVNVYGIAI